MIYGLSQRRATMFERSLHPALVVHNITAEVIIRLIRAASWIYKFARMAMMATFCMKYLQAIRYTNSNMLISFVLYSTR